ncbi:hypothetical protein GF406_13065, partial [candidate division KSB1 bacterium]|nr:hypothetical protein [candidate division KSB1 bacterium]
MPNLQVNSNLSSTGQYVSDGANNSPLALTDNSTGKVGIGTTDPNGLLDVYFGSDNFCSFRADGSGYDKPVGWASKFWNVSSQYPLNLFYTAHTTANRNNELFRIHSNESGASSLALRITAGNTVSSPTYESITVKSNNGNVGIGTTDPSKIMHIRKETGSNTYEDLLVIDSDDGGAGNGSGIAFYNNFSVSTHHVLARIKAIDANNWDSKMEFTVSKATARGDDQITAMTILGPDGNVGIGVTDPDEKLEVDGDIKLTDPTNDRVWATKKVFNILDFDADSSGTNDSKRAIQDAIDAASDAGGGTVIIPTGTYRIDAFGGTATGGSGTTLVDTAAHFTSRDIAVGDIVINLTNHCAGKITQINSDTIITVDDFVGNSTDADNSFSNGDNYVIPGIAMRDNVELSGQSFATVLQANPIQATDGTAYSGAIVLISADPSETWPTYKIQNLKIERNGSWSATDATDVGIDVYNHRFKVSAPQNGPVAWVIVDRIRFDHLSAGSYHFSTGIRMAAWSGTISNCEVSSCKIGI